MPFLNDQEILAANGLSNPFIANRPAYCSLEQRLIDTFNIFPGLCGVIPINNKMVATVFVDRLPLRSVFRGLSATIERELPDGTLKEMKLIQVQDNEKAWQFISSFYEHIDLAPFVVFARWVPHCLQRALEEHDALIAKITPEDAWDVGSRLEIMQYSRFLVASGISSLAHTLEANGLISQAIQQCGKPFRVDQISASNLVAYPIQWFDTV